MFYCIVDRHLHATNPCAMQLYHIIMRDVFFEGLFGRLNRFISDTLKKVLKIFFLHAGCYLRVGVAGEAGFLFANEFMRATARNLATVVAVASPGTAVEDLKISCS